MEVDDPECSGGGAQLPDSAWLHVLTFVSATDARCLANVSRICRRLYLLCRDREVWREISLTTNPRKLRMFLRHDNVHWVRNLRLVFQPGMTLNIGHLQLIEKMCPELRELTVVHGSLRNLKLFQFPNKLKGLYLRRCHVDFDVVMLSSLDLSYCTKLRPHILMSLLCQMPLLRQLNLAGLNFIVDDAALQLAACCTATLWRLCLVDVAALSDAALAALLACPMGASLHWLCLSNNAGRLTAAALRAVSRRTGRRVAVHLPPQCVDQFSVDVAAVHLVAVSDPGKCQM